MPATKTIKRPAKRTAKSKKVKKEKSGKAPKQDWYLYILRCADDSFYTGITIDVNARLETHNSGKGAKYTKSRGPCDLVYFEQVATERYKAMIRERAVKALTRAKKTELVDSFPQESLLNMIVEAAG